MRRRATDAKPRRSTARDGSRAIRLGGEGATGGIGLGGPPRSGRPTGDVGLEAALEDCTAEGLGIRRQHETPVPKHRGFVGE